MLRAKGESRRTPPFHSLSTVLKIQSLTESSMLNDARCFPLFPKLPKEIRCLIWTYCLEATPRIIGITNAYLGGRLYSDGRLDPTPSNPPSRPMGIGKFKNSLRQVNHEARDEANRLMQVYNPRSLPLHVNLQRDVFLFYWTFPAGTHYRDRSLLGETGEPMPRGLNGRVLRISRVALGWDWWWRYVQDEEIFAKAMGDLTRAGISEVFFLVAQFLISENREILFYEPAVDVSAYIDRQDILDRMRSRATTWEELEEDMRQQAKELQNRQAERRAKLQNTGVDLETLDETEPEDSNHHKAFFDASWWEIPAFKFVEAVQISAEDAEKVPSEIYHCGKHHYGKRVFI